MQLPSSPGNASPGNASPLLSPKPSYAKTVALGGAGCTLGSLGGLGGMGMGGLSGMVATHAAGGLSLLDTDPDHEEQGSRAQHALAVRQSEAPRAAPRERSRCVLHWPHLSLRFVFLCEPFKSTLSSIVGSYRSRGVVVTLPYRDKQDPTACMLIEGEKHLLVTCAKNVRDYMAQIVAQNKTVQLLMPVNIYQFLLKDELAVLKDLQGRCGVHIVLEPSAEESDQTRVKFDTRCFDVTAFCGGTGVGRLLSPSSVLRSPGACLPFSAPGSPTAVHSQQSPLSLQTTAEASPFGLWGGESFFSACSAASSPLGALSGSSLGSSIGIGMGMGSLGSGVGLGFGAASRPLSLDTSLSPRTSNGVLSALSPASAGSGPSTFLSSSLGPPVAANLSPGPAAREGRERREGSHALLRVLVHNRSLPSPVVVDVIADPRASCAGHGADCVLLLVDASVDASLPAEKIMQLNRGQALVDVTPPSERLPALPWSMIRARPLVSTGETFTGVRASSVDGQLAALAEALHSGLLRADTVPGTARLAIVPPPPHCPPLADLSQDLIHSLIATKTLQHAQSRVLENLRHIVLLDFSPEERATSMRPSECALLSSADSAGPFCAAILARIEAEIRAPSPSQSAKRDLGAPMQVLSASIPLPASLPESAVAGRDDVERVKMVTCLLRGQPEGILEAVKELSLLTQGVRDREHLKNI